MTEWVLMGLEVAGGIVLGFMAWSVVSPYISSVSAVPNA